MENWVNLIVSVLSGLVVIIPLIYKLIEFVQKATREKNWADLLRLVTNLMTEAEAKFATGAERKDYVLLAVKASADTVNYDIDMDVVSKMIDDLCEMSKVVNAPKEIGEEIEAK